MLAKYYDEYWKRRIKESSSPPIRTFIPKFLRKFTAYGAIFNCVNSGPILDVGCGDGNVSQIFFQKGEVFGVDISIRALKLAQEKGVKTKPCDLNQKKLPFKSDFFETVIFTDVIEHLVNPESLFKESRRVLKKGGRMIITVPNFARLGNRLRMLWGDPTDQLHWEKYGDEQEHLHWFTKPKLKCLLYENGFRNLKFVPTGLPWGFVFGILFLPQLANFLTVSAEK